MGTVHEGTIVCFLGAGPGQRQVGVNLQGLRSFLRLTKLFSVWWPAGVELTNISPAYYKYKARGPANYTYRV